MCEPAHSIVQYPTQDDAGTPTETRIDELNKPDDDDNDEPQSGGAVPAKPKPPPKPSGWWSWMKKKVGNWFHFSKLGFGHSEAIGKLSTVAWRYLPKDTKYETNWWNRTVKRDGPFYGEDYDKDAALECATEYARLSVTGNLTLLRQFLEVSMRKSIRPTSYVDAYAQILNMKGRTAFHDKMRRLKGQQNLDLAIKIMLSFTRKRDLLVPEWADDTKLWIV